LGLFAAADRHDDGQHCQQAEHHITDDEGDLPPGDDFHHLHVGADAVHGVGVGHGVQDAGGRLAHSADNGGVVLIHSHRVGPLVGVVAVPGIAAGQNALHNIHVVVGVGEVGDGKAFHAPLTAQDVGQQVVVAAGPDAADAVEGSHDAVGVGFLHGILEGLEVDLTGGLLVGPDADAVAGGLLVGEGEVLHVDVGERKSARQNYS